MAARLLLDWDVERSADRRGWVLIKPFPRGIAVFDSLRRWPLPDMA